MYFLGYRGRSCEGEVSLCDRRPCQNNGSCQGNQTGYICECPRGFAGPECQTNVNECLSNPCVHGVCEDGIGGYKCYCLPGKPEKYMIVLIITNFSAFAQ